MRKLKRFKKNKKAYQFYQEGQLIHSKRDLKFEGRLMTQKGDSQGRQSH